MTRHRASLDIAQLELREVRPAQLTVFSEIGRGRFKTVYSACHCKHGRVAVLRYVLGSPRDEVKMLAQLSRLASASAHLPEVYGARNEKAGVVLVQELAPFGSVLSVLQDPELAPMVTLEHSLHIAAQFADAVAFLESECIVHTDIACRNFLVFSLEDAQNKTNVKLVDFMHAFRLQNRVGHVRKKCPQATRWCAPETVAYCRWSHRTDVWSLGAALWELFAGGRAPWTCYSKRADVAQKLRELADCVGSSRVSGDDIVNANFPPPQYCSLAQQAHAAVLSCLQADPKARPSPSDLVSRFLGMTKVMPEATAANGCRRVEADIPLHESSQKVARGNLSSRARECRMPASKDEEGATTCYEQRLEGIRSADSLDARHIRRKLSRSPVLRESAPPKKSEECIPSPRSDRARSSLYAEHLSAKLDTSSAVREPGRPKVSEDIVLSPRSSRAGSLCAEHVRPKLNMSPIVRDTVLPKESEDFIPSPRSSISTSCPPSPAFFVDDSRIRRDIHQPTSSADTSFSSTDQFLSLVGSKPASPSKGSLDRPPTSPRHADHLETMIAFTSSPEAVCGLSIERLVSLRRELGAARTRAETSSPRLHAVRRTFAPVRRSK